MGGSHTLPTFTEKICLQTRGISGRDTSYCNAIVQYCQTKPVVSYIRTGNTYTTPMQRRIVAKSCRYFNQKVVQIHRSAR